MRHSVTPFLGAVVILLVFGLTTIWSTANSLFFPQLLFIVAGIIIAYLAFRSDLSLLFSLLWPIYLFSVVSLLFTLLLGEVTRGSTRWIDLGIFKLQVSEMVKPLLAIFFAGFLAENNPNQPKNLLLYLLLLAIPSGLIFIQPDLGSSLVIASFAMTLLFVSGLKFRFLVIGLLFAMIIAFPAYGQLKPYQQDRINSFINPYSDPKGSGYNIIQSVIAVGSGKIVGLGVKQGTQSHLKFLPERHTDFIYASFAEEFGLVGSTLLFASYLVLFIFWIRLASDLGDKREFLLVTAILVIFAFQATVNLGMNLGVMPVTGITLPFVSYGGSSIISLFSLIGITLNLNKRRHLSSYH